MKVKNFPERRRQRQLAALGRLIKNDGSIWEIGTLKIRTAINLKDVRTKKNRSGRARKMK